MYIFKTYCDDQQERGKSKTEVHIFSCDPHLAVLVKLRDFRDPITDLFPTLYFTFFRMYVVEF